MCVSLIFPEICFCDLVTSCSRTWDAHIVTVVTAGGCFSNIRTGVLSVIFAEAIHLHFTWLMFPQRNRKINCKFSSWEERGDLIGLQALYFEVPEMMGESPFSWVTPKFFPVR